MEGTPPISQRSLDTRRVSLGSPRKSQKFAQKQPFMTIPYRNGLKTMSTFSADPFLKSESLTQLSGARNFNHQPRRRDRRDRSRLAIQSGFGTPTEWTAASQNSV